jgi:extracellular factor (EF) 3-hydroxypalmitic acid methyl ester biosynthesis protein
MTAEALKSGKQKFFLVHGDGKLSIEVAPDTAGFYFFRCLEDAHALDADATVRLILQDSRRSVELGSCRIVSSPDNPTCTGRLEFIKPVGDLYHFYSDIQSLKMPPFFQSLPLTVAHRDGIRPAFKAFVADLGYDLQVYKDLFDALDAHCVDAPEGERKAVAETIIATEGAHFRRFFEDRLEALNRLTADFSPEAHQRHGYFFRKQLWNYICCCPFALRSNLKPRGYAGDSEQMGMIYRNAYEGDTTFSRLLHKHAVEHTASQSVRNRIALIAEMLECSQSSRSAINEKINVLSVGSGSAFELNHVLKSPQDARRYHFTLFDQDAAAVSEAAESIAEIENRIGAKTNVDYVRGSVRLMLFSGRSPNEWGKFNFIYSLGLFDYLTYRVAKALLRRLYRLLEPEGELVIGNFHVSNPSRIYMEYWGDWTLLHRTEEELKSLYVPSVTEKVTLVYDDTGTQMFLCIRKAAEPDKRPGGAFPK